MDINSIDKTLVFIDNIVKATYQNDVENFDCIDDLSKNIKNIIDKNRSKQPYHINIIDLLRANENAHSRILCELMKQNNNGVYEILESFVLRFFQNKINVKKPQITSEKHRIDLLIQEHGNYAIIFENKIHNATLQKNQLARYIEKVKQSGYRDDQIYVVYLPPDDYNQPNKCCWNSPAEWCEQCDVNYPSSKCDDCVSYENRFEDRFASLSFRRDILPWLKDEILHNCRMKDGYLYTSVFQYIDHLEGLFDIRTINNKLNMEIKEYIRKAIELKDNPEIDLETVQQKIDEVTTVLNHLNTLKDETEYACWDKWLKSLKQEYPNYKITYYSTDKKFSKVGVIMKHNNIEFAVLIERYSNIYYGIGRHDCSESLNEDIKRLVAPVLADVGGFEETAWWYGWKYTSFQDGYKKLVELISLVEKVVDK